MFSAAKTLPPPRTAPTLAAIAAPMSSASWSGGQTNRPARGTSPAAWTSLAGASTTALTSIATPFCATVKRPSEPLDLGWQRIAASDCQALGSQCVGADLGRLSTASHQDSPLQLGCLARRSQRRMQQRNLGNGGRDQPLRLGCAQIRVITMRPGALFADVDKLGRQVHQFKGNAEQVALAAHPLVGAAFADLVQRATGTGCQDNLVEVMFSHGPLDRGRSLGLAGEWHILRVTDVPSSAACVNERRHIQDSPDALPAPANKDANARRRFQAASSAAAGVSGGRAPGLPSTRAATAEATHGSSPCSS